MIKYVVNEGSNHDLLQFMCNKNNQIQGIWLLGLPRLEKTVNVYTEGINRNVHVYTSITH